MDLKIQENAKKNADSAIFSIFLGSFCSSSFKLAYKAIHSQKVHLKISQLNQKLFKNFDLGKIAAAWKIRGMELFSAKNGRIVKLGDPILTTNTIF